MLKPSVALLLIASIFMLSLRAPVFAQANALPDSGQTATVGDTSPRPDLRKTIAAESEEFKKDSSTFNPERAEKERIKQATKGGLSKGEKTFLVVFVIAIGVLVALLIKYGKECKTTTPRDCNIGSDENCYCEEYEDESRARR